MSLFATKPMARIMAESESDNSLRRSLGPLSLISLGVGGIIGAGIFTLTGVAAAQNAGPGLVISFVLAAVGCVFAGLCYSEFSTMIPISGSAYTYAYATMGELIAWIIGWDLILEYSVGAATVSIGWSQTLVAFLHSLGIDLPARLLASPFQSSVMPDGSTVYGLINLPAVIIVVLISVLLVTGIRESAGANNIIVILKVSVILIFIAIGWSYIHPANLTPLIPPNTSGKFGEFGYGGLLAGAGVIFFAYIGFDAVSTAAQEAKVPKRDMPIGIVGSLLICTILFILYAHVLTGMVNYRDLNVAAPLSLALVQIPYHWLTVGMNLAVLAGLTSVMLVMLLGQSRVLFSMATDRLLPKLFRDVHPKFRTPWKCNLMLMIFVAMIAAFVPIRIVGQMTSIGTLFAFVIVCVGIIIMRKTHPDTPRPFKTPLVPLFPLCGVAVNLAMMLGLGFYNWVRLFVWMALGLIIYFGYSRSRSLVTGKQ
jgi:basic amino acid/polyamine antiporter, APA family